jgi:FkbM family methyltransferase
MVSLKQVLKPGARFVARHRGNAVARRTATIARQYLDSYENVDYDIEHNGELRVLETLGCIGASCVLDVGANVGDWALLARRAMGTVEVHCFEVVPATARELLRNTSGDGRIVVNEFGLSDRTQFVDVRHFPEQPSLSTTIDYPQPFESVTIRGQVETGDAYLERRGIQCVDLLKVDVEGAEAQVLDGFASALAQRRIRAVQFEYGRANLVSRFLLKDHYDRFELLGYRIGKIYPTNVAFRPYSYEDEDFRGPNYLAVAESESELIAALSG